MTESLSKEDAMKKRTVKIISLLLSAICLFFAQSCGKKAETNKTPNLLGTPYSFLSSEKSRVPWDLFVFDGSLYVGAGDYDKNISPEKAMRYNFSTKKWEAVGKIEDEQINRFVTLGGRLVITGTDPTEDWSLGNFYVLENDSFVKIRTIEHGVHNFDMVEYNGMLFAALGVDDDSSPVVFSHDGGESFSAIPIMKDGEAVSEDFSEKPNRVYDFFLFDGELYILYFSSIYKYTENSDRAFFDFVASWKDKYTVLQPAYVPILAKCELGGSFFFTTGRLYSIDSTDGIDSPCDITPEGVDNVKDLLVYDNTLYLLCNTKTDSGYKISVRSITSGRDSEMFFETEYPTPAVSFAYDGKTLYLGIGEVGSDNPHNGEILFFDCD